MAALARQIRQLSKAPPEGVRYIPGETLSEILADVDGPVGTPYEGGVFRVRLTLGHDFPAAPPKGESVLVTFIIRACGRACRRVCYEYFSMVCSYAVCKMCEQ